MDDEYDFAFLENEFGKGIPFHEGRPIQLLNYVDNKKNHDEFGEIKINEEALNIIREFDEPVSIIAIIGSYRRGKSWFANVLHGRHDGFVLGTTAEGCTQGIYMWNKPFIHQGKRMIILDCEGIDDPKQNQQWASRLFILCIAISSTFIYNLNGVIGRNDIGKLLLMTDLAKFITPPSDYKFLPKMVVLLRDFMLKNPDDFKDYFLEKLNLVDNEATGRIRKYFSDFDVFGLPIPLSDRNRLQNLDKLSTEELEPEFVTEVSRAVKSILSTSTPKYIGSSLMTGLSFTKFLQECVEKLNDTSNSNFQLSIPSEYDSVIEYVARQSIKHCTQMYVTSMNSKLQQPYDDGRKQRLKVLNWEDFNEIHVEIYNQVEKEFFKRVIGSGSQIKKYANKLIESINEKFEEFHKSNSYALYEQNMSLIKKLWDRHVKVGLVDLKSFFKTREEFNDAITKFEKEIVDALILDCPETEMILAGFKAREYQKATETLQLFQVLDDESVNQFKKYQEAEQQCLEHASREKEMQFKVNKLENERKRTEEKLSIKLKDLEENIKKQNNVNFNLIERMQHEHELTLALIKKEKDSEIELLQKQIKKSEKSKLDYIKFAVSCAPAIKFGLGIAKTMFM
ncbi:8584_t:CDS:2 [Funneliformis mosseae]|uniref:8584_t:CDS:1 n=1 Tax=Funneliformis mosseae TaxID=27381 RepID=A0A9N9G454_FUNMO|nr:8584_t:CDS:2 [Funneliformis mosseae]